MSTFADITDLAAPRLPEELRTLSERIGRHDPLAALYPERLLAEASTATGLDDFGDDWFRTPLEVLCRSLRTEAGLSPLGALSQHQQIVRLLCARLRVEALLAGHPEVLAQHLDPPIVIAGLPRSGTTFLHGLLTADPGLRALAEEESEGPPVPGAEPGAGDPASERYAQLLEDSLPLMKRMLEVTGTSAHEEIRLLALSFSSVLFETQVPLPGYRDWYLATDQTPAYRYLARVLTALGLRRGGRWALKTMQHVEQLPAVAAAFPGATIVCTHRDPVGVIPSISTMLSYGQRLTTSTVRPEATAAYWTERILGMTDRCLRDHDDLAPHQVVDLTLAQLRDDPGTAVRSIYATAGVALTAPAVAAMDALQRDRHPHRHGRVRYDPAALGLNLDDIRSRAAAYRARFAVPAE